MKRVRIVETFEDDAAIFKQRRISVFQRNDGFYTIVEEYYYQTEYEGEIHAEGWAQHPSTGIFDSIETATTEALAKMSRRVSH